MRQRFGFGLAAGVCVLGLSGCATDRGAAATATSPSSRVAPVIASREAETSSVEMPRDLGGMIEPIITRAKIPGAVAMVLRGDKVIAQGAAGVRKWGDAAPVTLGDSFEICSAAKAMTASFVARLVEDGKLRWDTTLGEIFGPAHPPMDVAWKNVTVWQMVTHRAGLEDHLLLFARSVAWVSGEAATVRRNYALKILARPPDFAPGVPVCL